MIANSNDVATAGGPAQQLPLDGEALHKSVSPELWCVTRDDLRRLRNMVSIAVREKRIVPTALDPFDPEEDVFGPCIHTVNSQFIMPITALAGDCSWALMCHPCGHKCDLFVTHSWQEGLYRLYEFADKVLHSWPRGTLYAYSYDSYYDRYMYVTPSLSIYILCIHIRIYVYIYICIHVQTYTLHRNRVR